MVSPEKPHKSGLMWTSNSRNAVEPLIGHMKSDGRLARNFLKSAEGETMNALLSGAAGHLLCISLRQTGAVRIEYLKAAEPVTGSSAVRRYNNNLHVIT